MISVIIPTLNEEKNISKIISDIKKQNFKNFEIIVSDAYSKDKTEKIVIKNNCKFIKSKKRSPAQQRNVGAKYAKGKYLIFLDADSRIPQNFLNKAYEEFKKEKLAVASFY